MRFCEKRQPPLTKNFQKEKKDEDLQISHNSYDRPNGHILRTKFGAVPGARHLSLSHCLLRPRPHRIGIRL